MPRRKIENKNIRSLNKVSGGKSYSITIPVDLIRKWKWQAHQKLELKIDEKNKRIIIEDWKK